MNGVFCVIIDFYFFMRCFLWINGMWNERRSVIIYDLEMVNLFVGYFYDYVVIFLVYWNYMVYELVVIYSNLKVILV